MTGGTAKAMKYVLVSAMTAVVLAVPGCDSTRDATVDAASTVESDAGSATAADSSIGPSTGPSTGSLTDSPADLLSESPDSAAPVPTLNPEKRAEQGSKRTAKIGGPVSITYRIVGQPVIGQPLSIDLRVSSSLGGQPVRLDYRILDASALQLAEAQLPSATVPFATGAEAAGIEAGAQQVTVVPLREGRLYLNVAATVDTAEGSMSTVTAIPIQVGDSRAQRRENGRLDTGTDGEAVRVLQGSDD